MQDSESEMSGFFVPRIKWWKWIRSYAVSFGEPLRACSECGLVWSEIAPEELRGLIAQAGDLESKERLGLPP